MKKDKLYFVSFSVFAVVYLSSCNDPMPPIEMCIIGDRGCICNDPRLPEGRREYILTFSECKNYIATNPEDYQNTQEWIVNRCGK